MVGVCEVKNKQKEEVKYDLPSKKVHRRCEWSAGLSGPLGNVPAAEMVSERVVVASKTTSCHL